jgi:catechol 2,3-dioxygenase-like lactoylglutathione lyase family enzyme
MTSTPQLTLAGIVLDCPDAQKLAAFYIRLLGWAIEADEPGWVKLTSPDGGPGLSFQTEPLYTPPTWPSTDERQQMMVHLDIRVDDLDAGQEHALAAGATLADYQPQDDVRVFLDPAGHPFCFFLPGA